jgi:C-terminal processing protease CtpA/Prc
VLTHLLSKSFLLCFKNKPIMKKTNVLKWSICSFALLGAMTPSFAQQDVEIKPKEQKTEVIIINDDANTFILEGVEFKGGELLMDKVTVTKNEEKEETEKEVLVYFKTAGEKAKVIERQMLSTAAEQAETKEKPFLGVGIETVEAGVKITEIYDYSAAAAAGLLSGDIITGIDGQSIASIEALQAAIRKHQVGDQMQLTYLRNSQAATTTATLKARQKQSFKAEHFMKGPRQQHHTENRPTNRARYNKYKYNHTYAYKKYDKENFDACAELEELKTTPYIGVYIDLDNENNGVDINSTVKGTDAPNSALQRGDQIIQLNRYNVSDFGSLREALSNFEPGDRVRIKYARNGKIDKTRVTLSSMGDHYPYKVMKLEKICAEQQPVDEIITKEKVEETALAVKKEAALEVFPNPAVDVVNITFEGGIKAETSILVLDVQGKEVLRQQVNENPEQFNMQLDLSKLASGVYLISVLQGDQVISKQISLK